MRVLLVDNDRDYLNNYLPEIEKDYIVDLASTAGEGIYRAETNDYDVIVIDHSLPDKIGWIVCQEVRDANISSPILYLSDLQDSYSRTKSLKDGANVCLPKNTEPGEFAAQVRALTRLRHSYGTGQKMKIGKLLVDLTTRQVFVDDEKLDLRKREFSILEYLLLNRGRVVSKEELLDHIWEDGILVQSNSLEVHIRNLRLKIEKPFDQVIIKTLRGFGYLVE